MFQGVYFSGPSDFSLLFAEALSAATTKSIAGLRPAKNIRILRPNPLNIRIVGFQHGGLWEGRGESVDEKVDGERESTSVFLISFLLPVSEHCALTVSIATADGGPNFKARWNEWWW